MAHYKVGTYKNYEFIACLVTNVNNSRAPGDTTGIKMYGSVRDVNTKSALPIKRITLIMNAEGSNVHHPGWDITNDQRLFCTNCSYFELPIWPSNVVNEKFILGDSKFTFNDNHVVDLRFLKIINPKYNPQIIDGPWR